MDGFGRALWLALGALGISLSVWLMATGVAIMIPGGPHTLIAKHFEPGVYVTWALIALAIGSAKGIAFFWRGPKP